MVKLGHGCTLPARVKLIRLIAWFNLECNTVEKMFEKYRRQEFRAITGLR